MRKLGNNKIAKIVPYCRLMDSLHNHLEISTIDSEKNDNLMFLISFRFIASEARGVS